MYDRKTWIIVACCSVLLALNLYYSGKARQAALEQQRLNPPPAAQPAAAGVPAAGAGNGLVEVPPVPSEQEILETIETNGAVFTFTNIGGGVKSTEFKGQHEVGSKEDLVRFNRFGATPVGALSDGVDRFDGAAFALDEAQSIRGEKLVYLGKAADGLVIKKTFSKVSTGEHGQDFLMDFELVVENGGKAAASLDRWSLSLGCASPLYQAEWEQQTGVFWRDEKAFTFEDVTQFKGGWFSKEKEVIEAVLEAGELAGVSNQFFASVLEPREITRSGVWAKAGPEITLPDGKGKTRKAIRAGLRLPAHVLQPGEKKTIQYRMFIGPKQNRMLRKLGPGFGDVMNYGVFGLVSRFLNWVLFWVHEGMSHLSGKWSWGLAIIVLTIIVRIAIWPLHNASTRTMKRMSKLQPEMLKLKEKYPDDPQKVNQETMKLYRKFGINPMGGCLPMFVQIPIFFGFYRMLQYAVELRGKGFLWVDDLSQPDTVAHIAGIPLNLLPIVMALTSFLQMAMTPKTGDKMQQRIIMFMPFMFFFFCYNFASALALYWTTQNIFSIGQTWLMNKLPEPELKTKATAGGKKTWLEKLAEKQAEMERMQRERGKGGPAGPAGGEAPKTPKKRPPRTGG